MVKDWICFARTKTVAEAVPVLYGAILENRSDNSKLVEELIHRVCNIGQPTQFTRLVAELKLYFPTMSDEKYAKVLYGICIISSASVLAQEDQVNIGQLMMKWTMIDDVQYSWELDRHSQFELSKAEQRYVAVQMFEETLACDNSLRKFMDDDFCTRLEVGGTLIPQVRFIESTFSWIIARNMPQAKAVLRRAKNAAREGQLEDLLRAVYLQEGIFHVEEKRYGMAIDSFYRVYKCSCPQSIYACRYMVLCMLMINKAEEDLEKVISSSIKKQDVMNNLANAFLSMSLDKFDLVSTKLDNKDRIVKSLLPLLRDKLLQKMIIKYIMTCLTNISADITVRGIAQSICEPERSVVKKKLTELTANYKILGSLDDERLHINATIYARFAGRRYDRSTDYRRDDFFKEVTCCHLTDERFFSILPVRNQGRTKSCLAFALVDVLYASQILLTPLARMFRGSEQELLDCIHIKFPRDGEIVGRGGVGRKLDEGHDYLLKHGIVNVDVLPWLGKCMTVGDDADVRINYIQYLKDNGFRIRSKGWKHLESIAQIDYTLRHGPPVLATIYAAPSLGGHSI